MKGIVHGKLGGSLLVVMAFAIGISSARVFPVSWQYHPAAVLLAYGAGFFLAACFLPDRHPATFLSRRSALGAMAFFTWLGLSNFSTIISRRKFDLDPLIESTFQLFGPILITWLLYHLSYYLIRGFRAAPEEVPALVPEDASSSSPQAGAERTPPVTS